MKITVNGKCFYMNAYLHKNLEFVKDRVLNHQDLLIILADGRSGTGKSTCLAQVGYFLSDGKLSVDDFCFTIDEFSDRLAQAKKGDCVILDEAFQLNKRTTLSAANMRMLSILQKVRSKQCFIIIILPCVYDLDKNLILNLCDMFFHFYRKDFGQRGQYYIYDRFGLKNLWLWCRQNLTYSKKVARPNIRGRFTKFFPVDFDAYEKKKQTSIKTFEEEIEAAGVGGTTIDQRNRLIFEMSKKGHTIEDIMKMTGLKRAATYRILQGFKESKFEMPT